MNYKILLVDDEPDVLEFLSYNLKKEGYTVLTAANGNLAIQVAIASKPHIIILDVMMPGLDGIETCSVLKKTPGLEQTLIVFLTARSEDYSQIAGLEAGADDYITKPIKPKILISKIKAMLRRAGGQEISEKLITAGSLLIDKEKYIIIKDSKSYQLPRKEFELLLLLASKPDKVFTRHEIYDKIWGTDVFSGERTIDVHIRKIRQKLDIDNIKTIKGVGYKFETI